MTRNNVKSIEKKGSNFRPKSKGQSTKNSARPIIYAKWEEGKKESVSSIEDKVERGKEVGKQLIADKKKQPKASDGR